MSASSTQLTVCGVHAPLIFQLRRSEADPRRSNELTEEYLTSSLWGRDAGGIGPWHQGIDVFGEVAVCEADEEVAQIGVGLNAVHFTSLCRPANYAD